LHDENFLKMNNVNSNDLMSLRKTIVDQQKRVDKEIVSMKNVEKLLKDTLNELQHDEITLRSRQLEETDQQEDDRS